MAILGLQGMNAPWRGIGEDMNSMASLEVSQTFTVPGKLRAAREAGLAESRAWEAELEAARRNLAAEVRVAYATLYELDREVEALQESARLLQVISATSRARYTTAGTPAASGGGPGRGLDAMFGSTAGSGMRTGASSGAAMGSRSTMGSASGLGAVVGAQLEELRLEERLADLEARRVVTLASLNALLDRSALAPVWTAPDALVMSPAFQDPAGHSIEQEELADVIRSSPAVVVAGATLETARRREEAARLMRWPDLTTGLEYGWRGSLDPMISARLALEIPLWKGRKQDARARAAGHEREAAEAELRQAELAARAEAEGALALLRTARRQWLRYREEIEPRTALASEAARALYETGGGEVAEILESARLVMETRARGARREAEMYRAWARWEAVSGSAFTPAYPHQEPGSGRNPATGQSEDRP